VFSSENKNFFSNILKSTICNKEILLNKIYTLNGNVENLLLELKEEIKRELENQTNSLSSELTDDLDSFVPE
jgi:hypothetical protein